MTFSNTCMIEIEISQLDYTIAFCVIGKRLAFQTNLTKYKYLIVFARKYVPIKVHIKIVFHCIRFII